MNILDLERAMRYSELSVDDLVSPYCNLLVTLIASLEGAKDFVVTLDGKTGISPNVLKDINSGLECCITEFLNYLSTGEESKSDNIHNIAYFLEQFLGYIFNKDLVHSTTAFASNEFSHKFQVITIRLRMAVYTRMGQQSLFDLNTVLLDLMECDREYFVKAFKRIDGNKKTNVKLTQKDFGIVDYAWQRGKELYKDHIRLILGTKPRRSKDILH